MRDTPRAAALRFVVATAATATTANSNQPGADSP